MTNVNLQLYNIQTNLIKPNHDFQARQHNIGQRTSPVLSFSIITHQNEDKKEDDADDEDYLCY